MIDSSEVKKSIEDYNNGLISKSDMIAVISCYLFDPTPTPSPSPTPTPTPSPSPTPTPTPSPSPTPTPTPSPSPTPTPTKTPKPAKTPTATPTPEPTPALDFTVSAKVHGGGQDSLPLHDAKWSIAFNYLTLKLEDAPNGVNLADYDYRVRAPSGTGVQAKSDSVLCSQPWADEYSDWFSAETTGTDEYKGVFLVRCGFGDGVTKLEIWLRHRASGQVFTSPSYASAMRQPWHDEDHNITYQVACMPAPTTDLDFVAAIREAAIAWNSASAGITFGKLVTPCDDLASETGRVTVKPYTAGASDRCRGGVACALNDSESSDYPHLTTQEVLIKRVPQPGYTWSSDADGDNMIGRNQIYLPMVMIHEFGHTAGLWHSAHADDLMTGLDIKEEVIIGKPSSNDISAMKDINRDHTH